MSHVMDNGGLILHGFAETILLACLGFLGALVIGSVIGLFRISPFPVLRATAWFYVSTLRNMPLLLIVVANVFVLPQLGVTLPLRVCLLLSLMLYFGSYVSEILRSGVATVGRGQVEAARALGMSDLHTLRRVIAPQACRSMVQPLGTIFITTALATAVGSVVGVPELASVIRVLNVQYAEPLAIFGVGAALYITMTLTLGLAAGWVERRVGVIK